MSNYVFIDNAIAAPGPVSATATVQQYDLGLEARAVDRSSGKSSVNMGGGVFIYCRGNNASSIGNWVMITNNSASLVGTVNSTAAAPLGVAAGVLSATNVFGWVMVQGICDFVLGTNSSIPAGNSLFLAAGTAGVGVSNPVAGNRIVGAALGASYTSSQSMSQTVQLNRPFLLGVSAGL